MLASMKPPRDLVPSLRRLAKHLGEVCQTRAHADDWVNTGSVGFFDPAAVSWLEGREEVRVMRSDDGTVTAVKLLRDSVAALSHRGTQGLVNHWT